MAEFEVKLDTEAVWRVINESPGTADALGSVCARIAGKANALAAGYKSGIWHDTGSTKPPGHGEWHDRGKTYPTKGGTPAQYEFDVEKRKSAQVGIVYTANYAAQKENMQHNTLLKSI